jgi:hypothetical protein
MSAGSGGSASLQERAQTADDAGWIDELSLGMDEEFR